MEQELKRKTLTQMVSILIEVVRKLEMIILKQNESRKLIFSVAIESLGSDVSPEEDEYGCAESVNTIVHRAINRPIGGGLSTYRMIAALKSNGTRFKQLRADQILPGDIIISPTGYGNGKMRNGHVGIMFDKNIIMSNNSTNSKWEKNYTITRWLRKYKEQGGYPVLFYRIIN